MGPRQAFIPQQCPFLCQNQPPSLQRAQKIHLRDIVGAGVLAAAKMAASAFVSEPCSEPSLIVERSEPCIGGSSHWTIDLEMTAGGIGAEQEGQIAVKGADGGEATVLGWVWSG